MSKKQAKPLYLHKLGLGKLNIVDEDKDGKELIFPIKELPYDDMLELTEKMDDDNITTRETFELMVDVIKKSNEDLAKHLKSSGAGMVKVQETAMKIINFNNGKDYDPEENEAKDEVETPSE